MQLSQKQKYFSYFIVDFWNEVQILNIFKKKMILIGQIFPKLLTSENMVKSISKKFRFNGSFGKQHGKLAQNIVEIWTPPSLPYHCVGSWLVKSLC